MAETSHDLTNLPAADFPNQIPAETLLRLPFEVATEFAAVFFAETDTELSLGVTHPELLKSNVQEALKVLENEVGKKIVLFKITKGELHRALKQYRGATDELKKKSGSLEPVEKPPHYVTGAAVPTDLLTRIPFDYAKEHRLLAVDKDGGGTIWFVTDRDNPSLRVAVELIARRNRFAEKVITVPRAEFERLLKEQGKPALPAEAKREPQSEPQREPLPAKPAPQAPDKADELEQEGIISPDYKGTILTGEVEKPGFAGLFQRAGQLLSGKPVVAPPVIAPPPPPLPLAQPIRLTDKSAPVPAPTVKAAVTKDNEPAPLSVPKEEHNEEENGPLTKPEPEAEPESEPEPAPNSTPMISEAGVSEAEATTDDQGSNTNHEDALFARPVSTVEQLQHIVRAGSIPRIVAGVINLAVERKASDVHLEPFGDELLVRYRVDGQLSEVLRLPMSVHAAMVSRIKILSKLKLDESRIPQDGRFDITVSGNREVDIRVSTLPTVHGEKVVMRLLDKSEGIYSLEKLGLMGEGFNRLVSSIKQSYGVVLSTGPTGSGKTTTLYAILQRVATTNVNVITLEDPVEYEMKGINQSQIKPKIGFTFADGLRSVLRQDPNIIMVGEIRDGETAAMATHAALTGHLVLSTLHTNNAAGALPRLINMGIEPFLITSAMNAVVGQRLVRRICPECKEKFALPAAVRNEIDVELKLIREQSAKEAERIPQEIAFYRSNGCAKCTSGYKGRVGLFEVLLMSETIEDLAVRKAPAVEIEKVAVTEGMLTMKQDGILKVLTGITTLDEVLRETSSR